LHTLGEPGVHAWDLPEPPDPRSVDVARYQELLLRAAFTVLQPLGVSEERLQDWLLADAAYGAPPGELPARPDAMPPMLQMAKLPQLAWQP
jgi:hypothetical protein